MSDGVIYQCARGCTVAFDSEFLTSNRTRTMYQTLLLRISDVVMPECKDCQDCQDYLAVLAPEDDPSVVTMLCRFHRLNQSHRNLGKHVCTCSHDTPRITCPPVQINDDGSITTPRAVVPEPSADEIPEAQPIATRQICDQWTGPELDAVRVCGSAEEACTRYAGAHPGRRNNNAVTQKWQKLQKKGELLRVGGKCRISADGIINIGKTCKILSFGDGKLVANVELTDDPIATYQYDISKLEAVL